MFSIFDIVFDGLQIQQRSNFVYGHNNTEMFHANEICHNFQFDTFKHTINVSNMCIWGRHEFVFVVITHRYNNLFSRRSFSHHIDFGFDFTKSIDCLVNIFNFFNQEIEKVWVDFKNIADIWSWYLSVWLFFWFGIFFRCVTFSNCFFFDCLGLLTGLVTLTLEVNLAEIFCLKVLLFSSVSNKSYPAS